MKDKKIAQKKRANQRRRGKNVRAIRSRGGYACKRARDYAALKNPREKKKGSNHRSSKSGEKNLACVAHLGRDNRVEGKKRATRGTNKYKSSRVHNEDATTTEEEKD